MKRKLVFLAIVTTVISCVPEKSGTLSVQNKTFASEVMIYFAEDSVTEQEIRSTVANVLQDFRYYDSFHDSILRSDGFLVRRFESLPEQYLPPTPEYLMYSAIDMSKEDQMKLSGLTSGIAMAFFGTGNSVIDKQRDIVTAISKVTSNKRVFIGDLSAISFYTPASWKERRVDHFIGNDILDQVIMHAYREQEFCRIVTLGMSKFCLPDISVRGIPCSTQENFSELLNAAIATLADNPAINADSTLTIDLDKLSESRVKTMWKSSIHDKAKRKVEVKLKFVAPETGDNMNTQVQIVFEDPAYASQQEQQNQLLSDLFGISDNLANADHNDELLEASTRARHRLPELKQLFNQSVQPAISILLKAPFATGNGDNEWMWIEVTRWSDTGIEGILQNEPYNVPGLKSGSVVTVKQEDIFDYILYHPDGTMEGNETGKVIESQQRN